ncbi:hypothetical protein BGZ88_004789 [Linnemannia elongata]|nr:hypothetical protein BGZ88_004789 [Linnemannia elongata]
MFKFMRHPFQKILGIISVLAQLPVLKKPLFSHLWTDIIPSAVPSQTIKSMTNYNKKNACSHGVNSVDFAHAVCQAVVDRDPSATVSFIFNDLPDNDFDKVLSLVSSSAVATFNRPCTLSERVSNQARQDFAAYVSSRHQELRQGGKLVLSFPRVPDGQSGMNSCFSDDFKRIHEIVAERGAASLAWMQKYCNGPTYSRNRAEVASAFSDADWTVDVMELHDIEELGASDYRAKRITLDDIATRTADMLSSVFFTFTSMWVQYGGLKKDQAEDLIGVFTEALHQALKEPKALRVYHLWVIVATKK